MADTKPILVPLDGSKVAENALPAASWYSRMTGAPLKFVHVIDADTKPEERAKAAETFQSYANELAAREGLGKVECQVLAGTAADEVLSASVTAAAIVIGSHGRGGFRAMVIGSVADKIVRGAGVPVLIEPGTEEAKVPALSQPILVGVDGSDEAERGLAVARELAAKEGRGVVLLRTYSIPPAVGVEFATYPADLATTMEEAAKTYLSSVAKPGEKTLLRMGDATNAILEASEELNAALIVLTSSGKGLGKRIALGSTTDRVVHGSKRPVLVIPRGA